MEQINNIPESFYREIRSIEIYNAFDLPYINVFNGVFPDVSKCLYKINIIPESFERGLKLKKKDGNYFTNVDLSFVVTDLSIETIEKMEAIFNKKGFAMVLNSNTEKAMVGNSREHLTIEFIDNKKDDNSGNDESTISITGETILKPKLIEN